MHLWLLYEPALVTKEQWAPKKKFCIWNYPTLNRMVKTVSYVAVNAEKVQDVRNSSILSNTVDNSSAICHGIVLIMWF